MQVRVATSARRGTRKPSADAPAGDGARSGAEFGQLGVGGSPAEAPEGVGGGWGCKTVSSVESGGDAIGERLTGLVAAWRAAQDSRTLRKGLLTLLAARGLSAC